MPRLNWSPAALNDLQRIYRFLSSKNPDAARRAVAAIRKSLKAIEHAPELGRLSKEMDHEWRQWLVDFGSSGFFVLYRYRGDEVLIALVKHQRELFIGLIES